MTYKELLQQLQQLIEEQLPHFEVCVCDSGFDTDPEYYQAGVELVFATDAQDVLGLDHPIIRF